MEGEKVTGVIWQVTSVTTVSGAQYLCRKR